MIGVFIVNYNMPESTDAIVDYLVKNTKVSIDINVIDNGSDREIPSKHTNIAIGRNIQTTRAWVYALWQKPDYEAYVFIITSMSFLSDDVISSMYELLSDDVVGVHPSLDKASTTAWNHLINRGNTPRQTWFIDNVCSMYNADWLRSIGLFDTDLVYAYGIDLETCFKARNQGKKLIIDDRVQIRKESNVGYKMKRMGMSANKRQKLAMQNMNEVLTKKYGLDWEFFMYKQGVTDDLI